jgi:hypothetical protein
VRHYAARGRRQAAYAGEIRRHSAVAIVVVAVREGALGLSKFVVSELCQNHLDTIGRDRECPPTGG